MKIEDLVHNWLLGGADPQVGLRLFIDYGKPNPAAARILSKDPDTHTQTIKATLLKRANLPYEAALKMSDRLCHTERSEVSERGAKQSSSPKLRAQWPFLSDPTCPPELKLLISDKITAYTTCAREYEALSACTTQEQQLETLRSLVTNFINNHAIYRELKHYKDTGKLLGEHTIFAQYQRIRDLRNLNTMDLFKKKKNLEHAIWRNESKIKKDNRPDLLPTRQENIKQLKMQLAEVDRLLE